jgi:hypothetical protein
MNHASAQNPRPIDETKPGHAASVGRRARQRYDIAAVQAEIHRMSRAAARNDRDARTSARLSGRVDLNRTTANPPKVGEADLDVPDCSVRRTR